VRAGDSLVINSIRHGVNARYMIAEVLDDGTIRVNTDWGMLDGSSDIAYYVVRANPGGECLIDPYFSTAGYRGYGCSPNTLWTAEGPINGGTVRVAVPEVTPGLATLDGVTGYIPDFWDGMQSASAQLAWNNNMSIQGTGVPIQLAWDYKVTVLNTGDWEAGGIAGPFDYNNRDIRTTELSTMFQSGDQANVFAFLSAEPPAPLDSDDDGLGNDIELAIGTDPNSPDTDGDGLLDGAEYNIHLTDPLSWDTDNDGLPDKYEVDNYPEFDPCDDSDAMADSDGDGIENVHDYWNKKTHPWVWNPVCGPGCKCWGESHKSNGVVEPLDFYEAKRAVRELPTDYTGVIPQSFKTQDMDADDTASPTDLVHLKKMVKEQNIPAGTLPARPVSLVVEEMPAAWVAVGDTTHITLGVLNEASKYTSSFGVVFEIDPPGAATILGGEGKAGVGRYDVSDENGLSRVVLRVNSPGLIHLHAKIPQCGIAAYLGRYSQEIILNQAVTIGDE